MQDVDQTIADLGNDPPLVADGRSGPPDRREVSARWLSGTFLTGITSSILMGVALLAALDGSEPVAAATESAAASLTRKPQKEEDDLTSDRVVQPRQIVRAKDRRRLEVSTVSRVGDRDVIKTMPIMQVKMALAADYSAARSYPSYNASAVAADDDDPAEQAGAAAPQIYGTKVDSDMVLKTVDFPMDSATFDEQSDLSADEVEKVVRDTAAVLTDGDVQLASLHFVDPTRFGDSLATQTLTGEYGIKIIQENVSTTAREMPDGNDVTYAEDVIPFKTERRIDEALETSGYDRTQAASFATKLASLLNGSILRAGSVLRVGLEVRGEQPTIMRVGVYDGPKHIVTVAADDKGLIDVAEAPAYDNPEIASAFDDSPAVNAGSSMPTAYDGIYRASLANGLSRDSARRLVKLLAPDISMDAQVGPNDKLEVLFSEPDDNNGMSDDSQLLFVSTNVGGKTRRYYRFQMPDGSVDYFDPSGRNNKQSFLRNPMPSGRFRDGFGPRRHPILGYVRMHTGVDWAAPTGTPIIAAADGVVEKAGWSSGYGKQTVLKHMGGYETSYNHQSAFARGIVPGAKVKLGQVIGFVGTTGLSTGAHLHYEVIVNGTKVDPMRIRLPSGGKVLAGADLAAFKQERERIDDVLDDNNDGALKMAANKP